MIWACVRAQPYQINRRLSPQQRFSPSPTLRSSSGLHRPPVCVVRALRRRLFVRRRNTRRLTAGSVPAAFYAAPEAREPAPGIYLAPGPRLGPSAQKDTVLCDRHLVRFRRPSSTPSELHVWATPDPCAQRSLCLSRAVCSAAAQTSNSRTPSRAYLALSSLSPQGRLSRSPGPA